MPSRTAIVIITRNRRARVLETLERLARLPGRPERIVVDNGSDDGTPEAVHAQHPDVVLVPLGRNLGAAGRNVGARFAGQPFVAFADDDSWWADDALVHAERVFDAYPSVALIAARVLVGQARRLDPVCEALARSPLAPGGRLPGPRVLGFVACGAIVRRDALLAVGGFAERFGVGGEETLLAIDLTAAGHALAYVREVVAFHDPQPSADRAQRDVLQVRNALWSTWLRRRPSGVVASTSRTVLRAMRDRSARRGLALALRDLRNVMRERRAVSPALERDLARILE